MYQMFPGPFATQQGALMGKDGVGPAIGVRLRSSSTMAKLSGLCAGYFDLLPHAELLKSVARRVVDGAMLHLIKMWLKAPAEETDERGKKHRNTRNRDEGRGSPQGSPITPLTQKVISDLSGW